jgi:hypothetical protein
MTSSVHPPQRVSTPTHPAPTPHHTSSGGADDENLDLVSGNRGVSEAVRRGCSGRVLSLSYIGGMTAACAPVPNCCLANALPHFQQPRRPRPNEHAPPPTPRLRLKIFATLVLLGKNRNQQDYRWIAIRVVLEFLQVPRPAGFDCPG